MFKTPGVGQKLMAAVLETPVAVIDSFLDSKVFGDMLGDSVAPDAEDTEGFKKYMDRYRAGLAIERAAVDNLN